MDNLQTAERIKKQCANKRISVKTMLEECDIDKGFMFEITGRNRTPLADKLEKIAIRLDCSVDYLIGRTDNPEVNR